MELTTSWMRQGIEIGRQEGVTLGRQEGLAQGQRKEALSFVLRLLRRRFGTVPEETQERLATLDVSELEELGEAILDFNDFNEVTRC